MNYYFTLERGNKHELGTEITIETNLLPTILFEENNNIEDPINVKINKENGIVKIYGNPKEIIFKKSIETKKYVLDFSIKEYIYNKNLIWERYIQFYDNDLEEIITVDRNKLNLFMDPYTYTKDEVLDILDILSPNFREKYEEYLVSGTFSSFMNPINELKDLINRITSNIHEQINYSENYFFIYDTKTRKLDKIK